MLKTLPVILIGLKREIKTLALLDEGSTITLIENKLSEELGLKGINETLTIHGVGSITASDYLSKRVELSIRNVNSDVEHNLINVRTINNLNLPKQE